MVLPNKTLFKQTLFKQTRLNELGLTNSHQAHPVRANLIQNTIQAILIQIELI